MTVVVMMMTMMATMMKLSMMHLGQQRAGGWCFVGSTRPRAGRSLLCYPIPLPLSSSPFAPSDQHGSAYAGAQQVQQPQPRGLQRLDDGRQPVPLTRAQRRQQRPLVFCLVGRRQREPPPQRPLPQDEATHRLGGRDPRHRDPQEPPRDVSVLSFAFCLPEHGIRRAAAQGEQQQAAPGECEGVPWGPQGQGEQEVRIHLKVCSGGAFLGRLL